MNRFLNKYDKYSRLEISIYAVGWLVIFLLPILTELFNSYLGLQFMWHRVWHTEQVLIPIFLLFLLNNNVLLPELFFKKRRLLYFAVLLICFAVLWAIQTPPHMHHPVPPERAPKPPLDMFHLGNLVIELCVLLANFGIKVYLHSMKRDLMMLNVNNEKMQTELKSLKSQISPHFLMNTLNNIQSLIDTDPSKAYYTIQGLSRLIRYMLYENNSSVVPLQKEIDFMSNYIELMKIRYPDSVKVMVQTPVDCGDVTVPPLLYLSFLENAFKYGVSYVEDSAITVSLNIENERLVFRCANFKNGHASRPKDHKGIGIENVRRRLELIYGEDFDMRISESGRLFTVDINTPIKTLL